MLKRLARHAYEQGRRDQKADDLAFLRAQAAHMQGQVGDQRRRGAINHAHDRLRDDREPGRPEDLIAEAYPVIPVDERQPLGSLFPRKSAGGAA